MSTSGSAPSPRIVAGVDGSPSSLTALRWAVRYAQFTGGTVEAVNVWHIPAAAVGFGYGPGVVADCGYLGDMAKKRLDEAIAEAVGPDHPLVHPRVFQGYPAQVLLETAEGADLLVLGSRGHGELADILLGSVSQHCVHHAHCPVVVMRGPVAAAPRRPDPRQEIGPGGRG